jgi:preprotein translocase subunit SecA
MRELERRVLLSVMDRKWREHLYEMDYLRAGIHLRAMANRDPVVEYQREGYDMFNAMLDGIKEESVGFLFNLEVKTKAEQDAEAKAKQDEAEAKALAAAQEGTARVLARQAAEAKAAAETAHAGHTHAGAAPAGAAPAGAAPAGAAPAGAPTARRSGTARKAQPAAATAAPAVETPSPSGTGPELSVKGLDEVRPPENLTYSAPSLDGSAKDAGRAKAAKTATVSGTKETPRNAPCPCGSGKKYKQCHGAAGA